MTTKTDEARLRDLTFELAVEIVDSMEADTTRHGVITQRDRNMMIQAIARFARTLARRAEFELNAWGPN